MRSACYADGEDTTPARIDDSFWKTGRDTFLKIFTPYLSNEVGVSQRHAGVWDEESYRLVVGTTHHDVQYAVHIRTDFVRIEGLQLRVTATDRNSDVVYVRWVGNGEEEADIRIAHNILVGPGLESGSEFSAVGIGVLRSGPNVVYRVWNNVIYGLGASVNSAGIRGPDGLVYLYNNTVTGAYHGFYTWGAMTGRIVLKNNISINNESYDYYGEFDVDSSTNNAGHYVSTEFLSSIPGAQPIILSSSDVEEYFWGTEDFRIQRDARLAGELVDVGVDLSSDEQQRVRFDIAGTPRPQGEAFDVGAFEL